MNGSVPCGAAVIAFPTSRLHVAKAKGNGEPCRCPHCLYQTISVCADSRSLTSPTEQIGSYPFISVRIRVSQEPLFPFVSRDRHHEEMPPTTRFMSAPRGRVDVAVIPLMISTCASGTVLG